jgi:hypothetical protein
VTTPTTDGTGDWIARQDRYRGGADARRGKRLVTVAGAKSGTCVMVMLGAEAPAMRLHDGRGDDCHRYSHYFHAPLTPFSHLPC